ncbi:MAG TPA: 50S ribosomal protein L20 [Candidatus Paceibacterota bacterium]|jgi:large subunit ribosomal protein L20|nr:50S ribosomal protein L20 [Candidatus Paceibacterota bacterium]HRR45855.1 50S ribosomal protein L20 [Candidatus Paceibacterota bacterium]
MPRVKGGVIAQKKRRKVLKETKGFKYGRKSKERAGREALLHAYSHAFNDRKRKKREKRQLWIVKINAYLKNKNINYKDFIHQLKEKNIELDRKVLAEIMEKYPEAADQLIKKLTAEEKERK